MRNDVEERRADEDAPSSDIVASPAPTPPLLTLASDDDAVCVDDLCLPAEARP